MNEFICRTCQTAVPSIVFFANACNHSNVHRLFFAHRADTLESMGGQVDEKYTPLLSISLLFRQQRRHNSCMCINHDFLLGQHRLWVSEVLFQSIISMFIMIIFYPYHETSYLNSLNPPLCLPARKCEKNLGVEHGIVGVGYPFEDEMLG